MSAPRLTRRSVIAAGAGAVAAGLLRPAGGLAALASAPDASLSEQRVGRLDPAGVTVELPRAADLVGVQWAPAAAAPVIELRFRVGPRSWSRWVSAAGCCGGHRQGLAGQPAQALVGDPVWTGGTTAVQLRASAALSGVRLWLVDVSGGMGARRRAATLGALAAAGLPAATPVLNAGAGQPRIIARRAWAHGAARPRVAPGYGAVQMAFVHHTENPNGYAPAEVPAMLRAIYAYHRFVHGWNDIGYNFVVDLYGRIFEARAGGIDEPVVGAHAGGYNLVSTGVAVLGSFSSAPISPAARASLARLLAWKLALHGVPAQGRVTVRVNPAGASYSRFPANARVALARIAGHRDADSTDCPGNVLYGELAAVRRSVRRLAARPLRATLALAPPAPPAPPPPPAPGAPPPVGPAPPPPGEARRLVGAVRLLDGTPVAGARVVLGARTVSRRGEVVAEQPIGEAVTDAAGGWSLAAVLSTSGRGMSLRALFAGASGLGAAVSDPLDLPAPLAISAPSAPASAPPPSSPAAAPPAP
jgi:hypothetical protein